MKKITHLHTVLIGLVFLLVSFTGKAQQVNVGVDSTAFKIGEQITYWLTAEADTSKVVVFPEAQTFLPLEMVTSLKPDTTFSGRTYKIQKPYKLTQFDSGKYTIPPQKVIIGNQKFQTDSIQVLVNSVKVDTTKQEMFPIKTSVAINPPSSFPWWILWVLLGLGILAVLVLFLLKRKKIIEEKKRKLPPYEYAIKALSQLDTNNTLEKGDIKTYYSVLTEAVKRYIDEKIDDSALESTTNELITSLKAQKEQNKLLITDEVLAELEAILKRADLAKFAAVFSDRITAKEDRSRTEKHIEALRDAIPPPTPEELAQDLVYQEALQQKRKKRRKLIITISVIAVVVLGSLTYLGVSGVNFVKQKFLGTSTKELLQTNWISSTYGFPGVSLTTPEVLIRQGMEDAQEVIKQNASTSIESFSSGEIQHNLYVMVNTISSAEQLEIDLSKTVDGVYAFMEQQGAENIMVKDENFTTNSGIEGIRITGSFNILNPLTKKTMKKAYQILNFGEKGGFEQVIVIYNDNDEAADEIASRIVNSVDFKNDN